MPWNIIQLFWKVRQAILWLGSAYGSGSLPSLKVERIVPVPRSLNNKVYIVTTDINFALATKHCEKEPGFCEKPQAWIPN